MCCMDRLAITAGGSSRGRRVWMPAAVSHELVVYGCWSWRWGGGVGVVGSLSL